MCSSDLCCYSFQLFHYFFGLLQVLPSFLHALPYLLIKQHLLSIECKSASYPHERSFERRATRRASEASLGGLDYWREAGAGRAQKVEKVAGSPRGHAGRTHARFCGRIDHTSSCIDRRTTARRVVRAAHRASDNGTTQHQPAIDGAPA